MTPLRRTMVAGFAVVLGGCSAVALSACSDDDVLGNDDDGQVTISLTERDLKPGRVEVSDGKVSFEVRNDGDRLHAFAVETTSGIKTIKSIKPGETEDLTVELAQGRYRMYDPRGGYRERGVSGTIVVRDDTDTVTERTVERTVIDEEPDVVVPETDDPEVQEPEVQEPPAQPAPPPPPPPVVTQTVVAPPPPPTETTP